MTDANLVQVHQTGDGNCGVYAVACQFASLFVQAQTNPDIQEKLIKLYQANQENFDRFFEYLNNFHCFSEAQKIKPEDFGQFIQQNIHTLRDLELLVGPPMRLFHEVQTLGKAENRVLNNLNNLKNIFTQDNDLATTCSKFGLNAIIYNTPDFNKETALSYGHNQHGFDIRLIHVGGNHFNSVFDQGELFKLDFDLKIDEFAYQRQQELIQYVDAYESYVLFAKSRNGREVWQQNGNLFNEYLQYSAPALAQARPAYTPKLAQEKMEASGYSVSIQMAMKEAKAVDKATAIAMQQAELEGFCVRPAM